MPPPTIDELQEQVNQLVVELERQKRDRLAERDSLQNQVSLAQAHLDDF